MTTNNAVDVGLSGSTGTGTFVGATSPTLVTPVLGTPTSGTLTNCTGLPLSTGVTGTISSTNNGVTMVLKSGSNSASTYTTTSTSFTAVDGTNLSYTVTIPSGSKLLIAASGNFGNETSNDNVTVAIVDGVTVLQAVTNSNINTTTQPFSLNTIITGNGASHTIQLQWAVNAGTGYMFNNNIVGQGLPTMVFQMIPSA